MWLRPALCRIGGGVEGGIDTAIQAWKENEEDKEWEFLLMDARNAFS